MTLRETALQNWLQQTIHKSCSVQKIAGDASFRRYFRVTTTTESWVAMDAPPEKEDTAPFIAVATAMLAAGLQVPQIIAKDLHHGFLLLTDLGDDLYLQQLTPDTVDKLYSDAIDSLISLQQDGLSSIELPSYNRALLQREMDLFPEWYLQQHLGVTLSEEEQQIWQQGCNYLIEQALQQPQTAVHRDYHSRNLLRTDHNNPAIIDFQDAVYGPALYDVVSLLRDCYISWPEQQVYQWLDRYYQKVVDAGLWPVHHSWQQCIQWFDLMGIQRHLKAIGIFARLLHRDNKDGYIGDIPRTWNYIKVAAPKYPDLHQFWQLVSSKVSH